MIDRVSYISKNKWVKTQALTAEEYQTLRQNYGLPADLLTYVTDQDEGPNYVYDDKSKDELLIIHVPNLIDQAHLQYMTSPVSFLRHQGMLFTFNESGLSQVEGLFAQAQQAGVKTIDQFILHVLFAMMDSYIPLVKAITKKRNQLDKFLNQQAKNRDLVALSYLQQTLTFFSSAGQSNLDLLQHLPATHFGEASNREKRERLEDVIIEARQVQRMIVIENRVVDRISATFDSIINNNLNDTMKVLTIWSLSMAVPTIITGFYGMNMHLPLAKQPLAWLLVIGLSVVLIGAMLITLRLHHKM